MTITGTNFGPDVLATSITFGAAPGTACTSLSWINQSYLQCATPAGLGGGIPVTVTVAAQAATLPSAWDYDPPNITQIVPSTLPVMSSAVDDITLYGLNFGAKLDPRSILIGTLPCMEQAGGSSWISSNAVRCQHPVGGTGKGLAVTITVNGGARTFPLLFTNAAPQVTAVLPVNGPALGGTLAGHAPG